MSKEITNGRKALKKLDSFLGDVQRELLQAIRGKRSQQAVNRRFGKSFNLVYRWESGHTRISWLDFVKLCRFCKVPLAETAKAVWGFEESVERTDLLIKYLAGTQRLTVACKQFGVSRFVLADWLSSKSAPPLRAILEYLYHRSALVGFVRGLVDAATVPSLSGEIETVQAQIDVSYKYPWATHVLTSLHLQGYKDLLKHEAGYVARTVGITIAEEETILALLIKIKAIHLRRGKYVVTSTRLLDYRADFEGSRRKRVYWAQRGVHALSSLTKQAEKEVFGHAMFGVSDSARDAMLEAYLEFINKVISIYKDDPGPMRRLINLNIQMFDPGSDVVR